MTPPDAHTTKLPERIGTIFIVDDEPMVTLSLKTMLSLETKHLIHAFNSAKEALERLADLRPDVVISDFSMPEMDGITFLQHVKEQAPQATLILLTGYADKESAIQAINTVGIYRYMEKPWDNDELKLNIKNGLERAYLIHDLRQTIHQLSEAEAQLRENNQQLEALVEARTRDLQVTYQKLQSIVQNSADGIITLNQALEITSLNPTAEDWLEQNPVDSKTGTLSRPLAEILKIPGVPDIRSIFHADRFERPILVSEAFIGSTPLEVSVARLQPTTPPHPVEIMRGQEQDVEGYVLVLRDITQRKEVERLRDDFVSTLTHDLRTPLVAAIQTLSFFIDGTVQTAQSEKQHELTKMLIQSLRDMLGLVNALLEVYKYEAGRQTLVFDRVDLAQLVQSVCQELQALANSREQKISHDIPAGLPMVIADKQEIKRVFINLVGNAIHHTPKGGNIHVDMALMDIAKNTSAKASNILIQVKDNGRGIPQQDIPHLFQRFSQGTSNKRSSGSGLGLYLSRQIVDAHQGRIWVESKENVGSCFSVVLPTQSD